MSNYPTGDTALARAITTGAPLATNDAQAAELTQSRPTPGGEWYFEWNSTLGEWIVNGPRSTNGLILCHDEDDAKWLRGRLNAADAMEQALKAVAEWMGSEYAPELKGKSATVAGDAMRLVRAALRGGA